MDGGRLTGRATIWRSVLRSITTTLRDRTAPSHARVEDAVDLLAPGLTVARLADVVARLHSFFAATEPGLDRWADTDPAVAAALDWPRRRRSLLMAADVVALGASSPTPPPPVFHPVGTAQAFGWLYVAEGSTLGGAVIARRLGGLTAALPGPLGTFSPYPEGPGPMWRAYGVALERWTAADDDRMQAVADAAVAVFEALEHWVAPLRGAVPA